MKTQIPIYRAKKIDSDEYINGTYVSSFYKYYIANSNCIHENDYNQIVFDEGYFEEIDPSTLSIHFPDMLDSEGNEVFASLSEDGKGGDILLYDDKRDIREMVCLYKNYYIDLKPINIILDSFNFKGTTLNERLKVTGIQKWATN